MNLRILFILFNLVFFLAFGSLDADIDILNDNCSSDSDCPSFYLSQCSSGSCVSCTDNNDCHHFSSTARCGYVATGCIVSCSGSTDETCLNMRAICNSYGVCAGCTQTSDCVEYSSPVYCDTSTISGLGVCSSCPSTGCATGTCENFKCMECSTNSDCTDPAKSYCSDSFSGNFCEICTDDSDCSQFSDTIYCSSSGCVECTGNSDCTSSSNPYCINNVCSACPDDTYCSTSVSTTTPVCSSSGSCTGCTTNTYCSSLSSGTPYCIDYACSACTDDTYCSTYVSSSTPACASATGECVQCTTNTDCNGYSGTPYCIDYICSACTGDTYCSTEVSSTTPACSTSGSCVECTASSYCTSSSSTPYCINESCSACTSDAYCNTYVSTATPVCASATGNCVECTADSNCGSSLPYCASDYTCVECLESSDCTDISNAYCNSGVCEPCTDDDACTHFTSTPLCYTQSSTCVECLGDSDCISTSLSACSSSNTCEACTSDSQCTHISGKNMCYSGECVTYQSLCSPTYTIKISQNSNTFTITFPSSLVSQVDIASSLTLTLEDIPDSEYSYVLNKVSSTVYTAVFTFTATIPATTLILTLPCPSQTGYVYGDIQVTFATTKVLYTTEAAQQAVEAIQSVASTATTVMTSVSGSMMLAGANPAILWALMGLLQTFYYMAFINVQYPANVNSFFALFTEGNLSFIPNPMSWFFPNIDDESLDAPQKFLDYDVNGLFLQASGNMLLTWFCVSVGYGVSHLFLKYTRNMPRLISLTTSKTVEIFEWSGVFRTLITSYTQLTITAFLQVRVMNFETPLFAISSYCGMIFVVLAGVVPLVTWLVIYRFSSKTLYMKRKFGTLVEELKIGAAHIIPKYFNLFFLIRRLVLCLTLVFLYYLPYLEISVLVLNCFIWLVLLWKYLPYETNLNNVVNLVTEGIFLGIHIIIFILIHDDYIAYFSDQARLNFGWVIIGGCAVILIIALLASFVQQYFVLKKLFGLFLQVIRGKKSKGKRVVKARRSPPMLNTARKIYPEHQEAEKFGRSVDRLSIDSGISLDNSMLSSMVSSQIEPLKRRQLDNSMLSSSMVNAQGEPCKKRKIQRKEKGHHLHMNLS